MKKKQPKKFKKSAPIATAAQIKHTDTEEKKKKKSPKQFPKNSRLFTERIFRKTQLDNIFLVSFFCGMLLMAVILSSVKLQNDKKILMQVVKTRTQITADLTYWQTIEKAHSGYRDAYFYMAVRSMQLGNINDAKQYIQNALVIDPNFNEGKQLLEQMQRD